MITIYNREGVALLSPQYRDESHYTRTLMGEHHVRLRFEWHEPIALPYGSYIEVLGQRWHVWASYMPAQREGVAQYDVAFHAPEIELKNFTAFYTSGGALEAEWSLTGTLYQFALELRGNLERIGSPLSIDPEAYRDHAQAKHIDLSKESIADLLGKVAEAFDLEWWCAGGALHFGRMDEGQELRARLGELAHSYSPQGEGNPLISRLYAFGARRNLTASYRKEGTQALSRIAEPRLQLPQGTPYLEGVEQGLEHVEYFEEVYPRYEGTISAVSSRQSKDDTIYKIVDPDLHISKSYILEGQTLRAQFTSGALQGMDFDLSISSEGYEIVPSDSYGARLPSGTLVPSVGDRYVPYGFDISMVGAEYVERSEAELLAKATEWLEQNNEDRRDVEVACNPIWVYNYGTHIELGRAIRLEGATPTGDKLGRITKIEHPLYCPELVTLTVGNTKPVGKLERIQIQAREAGNEAKTLARAEAQRAVSIARRGMDEALQSMEQVEELFGEGLGERIEASALRTMQMVVGDPLLQYRFVRGNTDPTPIPLQYAYQGQRLSIPTSYLQHASIGTDPERAHTMQGGKGIESQPIITAEPYHSPTLEHPERGYYLYLHLSEEGGAWQGRFALYDRAQAKDETEGRHTLLVGALGAENEVGERSFTPLYGYTEVLPNQIRTARIVSSDARTWFDLEAGHIHGKITMTDSQGTSVLSSSTEISGGLVLSQTIGARDESGAVRSYLSGRASKPAFSAGVVGYDTQDEEATARINHDGTAHFGQMHLLGDRIQVQGKADHAPYLRLGGATQSLAELLDTSAGSGNRTYTIQAKTYTYSTPPEVFAQIFAGDAPTPHEQRHSITLVDAIDVSRQGLTLAIDLPLEVVNLRQDAYVTISLQSQSGTVLESWGKWVGANERGRLHIRKTITSIEQGTYRLTVGTVIANYTQLPELGEHDLGEKYARTYIMLEAGELKTQSREGVYETVYGRSGFYSYWSNQHLLYFGREGLHVGGSTTIKGTTDIPGLLASGRVQWVSGTLRLHHTWGAKAKEMHPTIGTSSRDTDLITVYHGVGHTKYSVQITINPNRDKQVRGMASVVDCFADRFTLYITDAWNNTRTDFGFSFAIFGHNGTD